MACLFSVGSWIFLIQIFANNNGAFGASHLFKSKRASNIPYGAKVFKDDTSFKPKISKECEITGICEQMPDYPRKYVESLLRQIINTTTYNEDMLEIANRFWEDDKNLPLCRSLERLMRPQAARNINNQWYYVINEITGASQSYRVEICETGQTKCGSVVTFASGYRGGCKQKFILRKMVALDYNGRIFEAAFQVPSCCSCVYEMYILK